MPTKLESAVNIPRAERFRAHVGERWAASVWERYEGREKGMELRFTFLNRWPATHTSLSPLRANSIYLEKDGRRISFPPPRFQNYCISWGEGLDRDIWFGNDSLGSAMEPEGLFLIFLNGELTQVSCLRCAAEAPRSAGSRPSPLPSAAAPR